MLLPFLSLNFLTGSHTLINLFLTKLYEGETIVGKNKQIAEKLNFELVHFYSQIPTFTRILYCVSVSKSNKFWSLYLNS
jgi:hypothetical protein